ncbi:MAG: site-specific DNA-methyltransferase [Acidobacteriota bacterium]
MSASSGGAKDKFLQLLRELFQFDCADLDFGIYRIMNHKRKVIERFIFEDLPKAISEELQRGALAELGQAQQALAAARQKVVDALGEDALDADGNLAEKYRDTKAGKEYLEAKTKAVGSRPTEALEASIYNHLYTFFSRYWQDGDFISKRRYSKKERYAIPYNGQEVYLYWANHDQYYVKTGEYFTDYTYRDSRGVTVHFKLQQADVEQNNVKGEKRFFLPVLGGIAWDDATRTLVIPFQFRPLTAQESIAYGQKNQQEAIIAQAVAEIPKRVQAAEALAALTAERRKKEDSTSISLLEHHLRQYTRRNTSDFFIHKDLKGFLSRELDFYLKNEVLNLDEMETAGEKLAEGWFQLMRLVKRVGLTIIDFLAQIENFQKLLWEKKKFITETFYVITVGNIPEDFYPEIAACEAQWEEWGQLLSLSVLPNELFSGDLTTQEGRLAFLKAHPTLPLDTRHFSQDFTDRLLVSFEDLDELTDGLLMHSENWQALNLMQEKYRERVKCIYIDPPYNTGGDEFLYRDAYQHSSWLTMMENRLALAKKFMLGDGTFFSSIDDVEQAKLRLLLDNEFDKENFIASIAWWRRHGRNNNAKLCSDVKDFVLWYRSSSNLTLIRENRTESSDSGYSNPDNDPRGPWTSISYVNPATKSERPNLVYPIRNPFTGEEVEHPTNAWKYSKQENQRHIEEKRLYWGLRGEHRYPRLKIFLSEVGGLVPMDVWTQDESGTTDEGSRILENLFGKGLFSNPKPPRLVEKMVNLLLNNMSDRHLVVLDYFAGSGTTGHAVINLNREDGGRRKFILVEVAHYFDTVLLPRIKKVTFTPEWKDGKPKRMATPQEAERSPRIIKVIRLESYEDALNNLTFDEESGQKAQELFKDDYLLHYMLRWETRKSETLLDVEKLQTPFSYKLRLHRDGETRERLVDLPETFNYLLGLDVQTRRAYDDDGRRYLVYRGTLRNGGTVVVLWRETKDWTKEDYERDRDFVAQHKLTEGADEIFVNGDSLILGAQSLDLIFKERMFAGPEA